MSFQRDYFSGPSWRERVAERIDRVRTALTAPTPLAWGLAGLLVLAAALLLKTAGAARAADFGYWLWLEMIGGDR